MRTSIYVLAFLLPLKGALAVCPEPSSLTPDILEKIQDRLKTDDKDLQLPPINYTKYKVIRGLNAATNYGILSGTSHPHIKLLPSPAHGMCAYSVKDSEKEESEKDMVFILQAE